MDQRRAETFERRIKFRDTWSFEPDKTKKDGRPAVEEGAGHRAYVTKIQPEVRTCIENFDEDVKPRVIVLKTSLEEQLATLTELDKEILKLLEEKEDAVEDEELENEIEESCNIRAEIRANITIMNHEPEIFRQAALESRQRPPAEQLRKQPVTHEESGKKAQEGTGSVGVLDEYDAVIKEQLATGIIERVAELEKEEKVHYIPHLAVIRREASTTKLRIVYADASSSEGKKSTSLNDCLHVGPSLNPLLFDILVRFREKRVVLIGDIEKVFLNVEVDKADRDCLRFLWLEDVHKPDSQIAVYRFSRVVFGLNASPFLLNATLRHHISKYKEVDPEFVKKMIESFYVDDLVTGGNNTSEGHELYRKTKQRMASGGFGLRKWKTNDKTLRALIAKEETNAGGQSHSTDSEQTFAKSSLKTEVSQGCQGVLGVPWNQETDKIQISFGKMVDRAEACNPLSGMY